MSGAGGKGAGIGLKLLIGAGALAYGVKEATFTGRPNLVSGSEMGNAIIMIMSAPH